MRAAAIAVAAGTLIAGAGAVRAELPPVAAYWSFDAADINLDGGVVFDVSGNAFDGTILGVEVASVPGQREEALHFPRLDTDHVDLGDVLDPGTGGFTVALWFWLEEGSGTQFLIGKGNAGSTGLGWSIWIDGGTTIQVRGQQVGATNDQRFGQRKPDSVAAGTWHHVALVIDRETETIRGYIDGTNDGFIPGGGGSVVDTLVPGSSIETTDSLLVARRATDGAPFGGSIDDVAIWSEPLTGGQVAALYRGGSPLGDPTDTTAPASPEGLTATAEDGRVLLDWDDVSDLDTAGYNVLRATDAGGPFTAVAEGVWPSELVDEGLTNGVTYWYAVTAEDLSGNESEPSAARSATPQAGLDLTPPAEPTGLRAIAGLGTVTLEWDPNDEEDLVGYDVERSTTSGGPYVTIAEGVAAPLHVDTDVETGTTYHYVVRARDIAGNPSEPSAEAEATPFEAEAPPAPLLYWSLDAEDMDPPVIYDLAGNAYDGEIIGESVDVTTGRFGEAIELPGSDIEYVEAPDGPDPGFDGFTASLWFRAERVGDGAQFLMGKGNASSGAAGWSLWTENSVLHVRGQYTVEGRNEFRFGQQVGVTALEWHHVALVIDREAGTIRGYLDGTNEGWTAGGGGAVVDTLLDGDEISSFDLLRVGRRSTDGAPFTGRIDDVAIWDQALTPGQILALASGVPPIGTPGDTTPPGVATGLVATGEDSRVLLDWDDAPEADVAGYRVHRSTTEGSPGDVVAEVSASEWLDESVENETTYFYSVSVFDRVGNESDPSGQVEATPREGVDATPPAAPVGLRALAGDAAATLRWSESPEEDLASYSVYRAPSEEGPLLEVASGLTEPFFEDSGLENGREYRYVVTATDTSGNESASSVEKLVTPSPLEPFGRPIAYWSLDATSVDLALGSVEDLSGEEHEGTILGVSITLETGVVGESLLFPGDDADHVDLGVAAPEPLDGDFSVSLWFRVEEATGTRFLVAKGNSFSAQPGYSIWLDNASVVVRGGLDDGLKFGQHIPDAVEPGTWHHVAMVVSRGDGTVRGYLDGSNEGWLPGGGGAPDDLIGEFGVVISEDPLLLGRRNTDGAPLAGQLDDVAIWEEALTPRQILALAAGEPPIGGEEPDRPLFFRGDADGNGAANITDGIYILNFLFLGGPEPPCSDAADADDSGVVNITDGIYVLNFLFLGGPDPVSPGPPGPDRSCGPDTELPGELGNLGCERYDGCP